MIEAIFDHVGPGDVVWISIGTFRFMPHLKSIIESRFPDSTIPYGEFITGLDNKMRYFKPLRIAMYQRLAAVFRQVAPGVTVYFCMEDEEVWMKTFGFFQETQSTGTYAGPGRRRPLRIRQASALARTSILYATNFLYGQHTTPPSMYLTFV